jgi:hypothetical protein
MELLDFYNGNSRLSFNNEVKDFEFIQILGDMGYNAYTNPEVREEHLSEIGKTYW